MILAAEGDRRVIAADMLAQAEHDPEACAILITCSEELAKAVSAELEKQLRSLPTAEMARQAIEKNSRICDRCQYGCRCSACEYVGTGASKPLRSFLASGNPERRRRISRAALAGIAPEITQPVPAMSCPQAGLRVCAAAFPLRIS